MEEQTFTLDNLGSYNLDELKMFPAPQGDGALLKGCLLYTSPSPRD